MDLGTLCDVRAYQINFADQDALRFSGRRSGFAYRYLLEGSADGINWFTVEDRSRDASSLPHIYSEYRGGKPIRFLRLTNRGKVPAGGRFAVSGLRIFGFGDGEAPRQAPDFTAVRGTDEREMRVSWAPVSGAEGYTVRFGIHENELNTHWQVIGETNATIRCLTAGIRYYVKVDAYNENGIAPGRDIRMV